MSFLHCGKFSFPLDRPLIMGVINVTPDSFSDGNRYLRIDAALAHARRLIDEGADLLDIGGESTRPGAAPVALDEERRRVLPVIAALADSGAAVSIDTQKPELMREAVAAGAAMVNDVNGFQAPGALAAVAGSGCAVCIMHRQGDPRTMQQAPQYGDVVAEVGTAQFTFEGVYHPALVQQDIVRAQETLLERRREAARLQRRGELVEWFSAFHEETSPNLERALSRLRAAGAKGLVLDLRNNPGGLLVQAVRSAAPDRRCRETSE